MSEEEIDTMMQTPVEEVMEKTLQDLADYRDLIDDIGLGNTIDFINEELDRQGEVDE